jgi:hypothetical protein
MPPGSCGWIEEPRLLGYHLDAESFLLAAHDMDRLELAALDTLQHGYVPTVAVTGTGGQLQSETEYESRLLH